MTIFRYFLDNLWIIFKCTVLMTKAGRAQWDDDEYPPPTPLGFIRAEWDLTKYYFRDPAEYQSYFCLWPERDWCWRVPLVDRLKSATCRLGGHGAGPVWFNPGAMSPDESCQTCGDKLDTGF